MGAGAGGAGMSSAGAGMSSAIYSLLSENIESETEEVSDFVRWTRSGENFSTELCQTKFLSSLQVDGGLKLSFFCFCESAVFLSWLLDLC